MKSNQEKYEERCLRALGIMSREQLKKIQGTRIGVAGLGLGGSVFVNLVRLGFQNFHVADPDVYERTNVNRQRAAKETTLGSRKDDCLIQEALAINPDVAIKPFRTGVTMENVREFVSETDWIVDAVDVFAMREKLALHEEARNQGKPVVTCVSVGFGASIVVFDKSTPSFCELSGLNAELPYETNISRFVKFVTPEIPDYMSEQLSKALTKTSHIPFVVPGVEFSASMVVTEICKNILNTGERILAPKGIYLDPVGLKLQEFTAHFERRPAKTETAA